MLPNEITWVIVFDSSHCSILTIKKKPKGLNLIKELNHPENKLRDIDLTSDKPGRYKTSTRHMEPTLKLLILKKSLLNNYS